jgi:DNA-binding CsgD family transcriptional regulator
VKKCADTKNLCHNETVFFNHRALMVWVREIYLPGAFLRLVQKPRDSGRIPQFMARPRKVIDVDKLELLASVGCPANEIAAELDCSERTINSRFHTHLKKGHERCKTRIRSKLFKEAMAGNTAALIFLGKAVCGLRENDPGTTVTVNAIQNANAVDGPGVKERLAKMHEYIRAEAKRQDGQEPDNRCDGLVS